MLSRRSSLRQAGFALAAAALLGAAVAAPSPAAHEPVRSLASVVARTPIKHVVIIYQENHSFDDVLGRVCRHRATPCNGRSHSVTFPDGKTAKNIVQPDVVPFVLHTARAQRVAMAGRWDRIKGCFRPPYNCVSHVRPRAIPNLAALANRFAVSDATFASDPYASFGMHVALAAGTVNGFGGGNPHESTTGAKPGPGWGCASHKDTLWQAPRRVARWVPSCIPSRHGNGPYRHSPVPYAPTIMERFEQAGLSWHIYQGDGPGTPPSGLWSVCTYFYWCAAHRFNPIYDSATTDFVRAARAGRLPKLSLMLPAVNYSQHNNRSMSLGDNYIGRIVNSVMKGPDWGSTAIFITYDDCGCFYDHVKPPPGLGIRNPMVIVSPWARRTYTDSRVAVQPYSMLAFLQYNFRLRSLSTDVDNAYDYSRSFNFSRRPLSPIPMTKTVISAKERRVLAAQPPIEGDPT